MLPVILFISKCLKYQTQLTKCSHQVRTAPLLLSYLSVSNIVIVGITLKFYGNLHYVIFIFDFICEKAFFLFFESFPITWVINYRDFQPSLSLCMFCPCLSSTFNIFPDLVLSPGSGSSN